jgi:3-dehydroquinate dehydratase-2
VELHLPKVHGRECSRLHFVQGGGARAVMCGFGVAGYGLAIDAVAQW